MASDFVCRIPLKPTDEPPKEDEVRRLLTNPKFRLADEFAVRYLESIGAAPTPANMAMVKKEIPSKRFKLKAAYKSRGGLEDMIYMEKVEPKNEGRHLWRGCAARSLFSEMVNKKLSATTPAQPPVVGAHQFKPEGGLQFGGAGGKTEPRDSARLPKLDTNGAAGAGHTARAAPMSPSKRDDIASRVALARLAMQSTREKSRSARSRQGRRSQVGAPDFVEPLDPSSDVVSMGLKVAMDDILSIQTMFTRTFPLAHIRDRLTSGDLAVLVGELTGINMARLILHICRLCEWVLVHDCNAPPGHDLADAELDKFTIQPMGTEKKEVGGRTMWCDGAERGGKAAISPAVEEILVETFRLWIDMQGRISRRQHMVISYPIYLMLVRVAVETVLRNAVPFLFKGPKEEVQSLQKTEGIVSMLLDPDGYLNYPLPAPPGKAFVEALQPSHPPPEGVPALNPKSRPWAPLTGAQGIKSSNRDRFYTVSSHVKTLLGSSNCPQLNVFRHAQNPSNIHGPPQGGGKTPRGEHDVGAGLGRGGEGGREAGKKAFNDVLNSVFQGPMLEKIYHLALKKRDMLRHLGDKRKLATKQEQDDDALNTILPMGVEHLSKRTGLGGVGPGGVR